jgi:hypothetical protein
MSLLLLLPGASVASDDRTFAGTWVQAAATWDATLSTPVVSGRHGGGKPLSAATVVGPAGARQKHLRVRGAFIQPAAGWAADLVLNDDELAIALLLGVFLE